MAKLPATDGEREAFLMSMTNYRTPYAEGMDEFTEKKSRFIGHIFKVTEGAQAVEIIKQMQKKYWDASCNAYGYIVEEGRVMRYSDGGEPQGTAGQPILEVLKKEELFDVLCVVTRYFGGIKLGAGGLTRAYGHGAKIAVDAAGIALMTPYRQASALCPYRLLETVRSLLPQLEAEETGADYAADVTLSFSLPDEKYREFEEKIVDVTAGTVRPQPGDVKLFAKRIR